MYRHRHLFIYIQISHYFLSKCFINEVSTSCFLGIMCSLTEVKLGYEMVYSLENLTSVLCYFRIWNRFTCESFWHLKFTTFSIFLHPIRDLAAVRLGSPWQVEDQSAPRNQFALFQQSIPDVIIDISHGNTKMFYGW